MELTSEERQRIYEEEKARAEAKYQIESEQANEQRARQQKEARSSCLGCLGGILGFIFLIFVIASCSKVAPPGTSSSNSSSSQETALSDLVPEKTISMDEFSQISMGMSYEQVKSIIGAAGELSSENQIAGYHTAAYSWKNYDGSNAIIMFQNDRMVQKSQFGL